MSSNHTTVTGGLQGRSDRQQVHADTKTNGHNNFNNYLKTKIMNKKYFIFGIVAFFLVLGGCQKDDAFEQVLDSSNNFQADVSKVVVNLGNVDEATKRDAIEHYGRIITIADFPVDKLLDVSYEEKLNRSISKDDVGGSPDRALVPLIFDHNGVLYTAKRYNTESDQKYSLLAIEAQKNPNIDTEITIGYVNYLVDLQTFANITTLKEATDEYTQPLPTMNSELIWFFDPYVKFFEKRDEQQARAIHKYNNMNKYAIGYAKSFSIPSWAKKGNIIFAKWNVGGISDVYGHTGGISKEPTLGSSVGAIMTTTKTIEASNNGKSLSALTISTSDGVFERYMSTSGANHWNSSSIYQRHALWKINMTNIERNNVVAFMKNQIGKSYLFASWTKNTENTWYCSKLQWKAYKVFCGIDVDSNGGNIVYPLDIVNSNLLVGMSF